MFVKMLRDAWTGTLTNRAGGMCETICHKSDKMQLRSETVCAGHKDTVQQQHVSCLSSTVRASVLSHMRSSLLSRVLADVLPSPDPRRPVHWSASLSVCLSVSVNNKWSNNFDDRPHRWGFFIGKIYTTLFLQLGQSECCLRACGEIPMSRPPGMVLGGMQEDPDVILLKSAHSCRGSGPPSNTF